MEINRQFLRSSNHFVSFKRLTKIFPLKIGKWKEIEYMYKVIEKNYMYCVFLELTFPLQIIVNYLAFRFINHRTNFLNKEDHIVFNDFWKVRC